MNIYLVRILSRSTPHTSPLGYLREEKHWHQTKIQGLDLLTSPNGGPTTLPARVVVCVEPSLFQVAQITQG